MWDSDITERWPLSACREALSGALSYYLLTVITLLPEPGAPAPPTLELVTPRDKQTNVIAQTGK